MHILVTNDDGVNAPGLLALAEALKALGKVTIFAPDRNWSVSGHVKTLHRPLRVSEVKLPGGVTALTTDGSPADCVALMALGLLPEKVDLVASGINPVPNLGLDMTYSGTVTAAFEGVVWGYPSLAFSLDSDGKLSSPQDFQPAALIALQVAENMIANPLPPFTILNVNIPNLPQGEVRGFRVTRQGPRIYRDALVHRTDPFGHPYYWIGGDPPQSIPDEGSDAAALLDGYVSVNPIHLDLTAHDLIPHIAKWDWPALPPSTP
jgi:5'-nucleotidase